MDVFLGVISGVILKYALITRRAAVFGVVNAGQAINFNFKTLIKFEHKFKALVDR